MKSIDHALSRGIKPESLAEAFARIKQNRDRLAGHQEWRLSSVEVDMMILTAAIDGLLDGTIRREEFVKQATVVCQRCGKERPNNGMLCWNCSAR